MVAQLLAAAVLSAAPPTGKAMAVPTAAQIEFFEKNVRPVLADHCYRCHSEKADKVRGGLKVDTLAALLAGGAGGPAVVPGDLSHSLLIQAVRWNDKDLQMPPKAKLPDAAIAALEQWVRMGAPHPDATKPADASAPPPARTTGIDIEKGREFWSFRPPVKLDPPRTKDLTWARSPIDGFLLAGLDAKDLKPAPDADRPTLIRRLSFDLIGLPPTPEEAEAFVRDRSSDAYEKLVDRLLASPRFGERWGRHWLDVARYAESSGKEANVVYPHAWRYRDWVIAAFNADEPYDRFLRRQLAGDLLQPKSADERAANLIATGYLAIGTKGHNTRGKPQFAMDLADEQIDAVGQGILGVTIACARCHDHKFDPIPQRDYYALAGVFLSTDTEYGTYRTQQNNHPATLASLPSAAALPDGPTMPTVLRQFYAQQVERAKSESAEAEQLKAKAREAMKAGAARGNALTPQEQQRLQRARDADAVLEAASDVLARFDESGKPTKANRLAMAVTDRDAPINAKLLQRGEIDKPGPVVPRGFPQVLTATGTPPVAEGSGRLQLADWITARGNPLTARVWANRIWLHLMGKGLVPTPDNFGASGTRPANQALLDWLAVDLMEHDWSTKSLIRTIVTSHAYRMSSRADRAALDVDPDDTLWWRMPKRRLDAEAIRDAMLMAAGTLDLNPPVGSPVALLEGGDRNPIVNRLLSADSPQRSVYLPVLRDHVDEMLDLFDFAEPAYVSGDRDETSVPTQALYLMNSERVTKAALAMADRLLALKASDAERVERAFQLCYGRRPSTSEMSAVKRFFGDFPAAQAAKDVRTTQRQGWAAFCQALFQAAEFRMID